MTISQLYPPLFAPKESLHCYNRFIVRVSDSYSNGGAVAVANGEFPRS